MTAVLLDTHAFVWGLYASPDMGSVARRVMLSAQTVYVPPCAFHEITMKHRAGKWPLPEADVLALPQMLARQGGVVAPYTAAMAMLAVNLDWDHRDPFDRMIAATALELGCPLLSKDAAFDALSARQDWPGRVW